MRRRAFLASMGVLSAGCLGSSAPRASNSTRTPPNSETSASTATETCDEEDEPSTVESSDETVTDGEYRVTSLTDSMSVNRPSAKYILERSASYSEDAVRRKAERTGDQHVVTDISEVDDEPVRNAIETAVRSGEWRSNTLPDGLHETVDRVDFFTGVSEDDTYTHIGVTLYRFQPNRPPAVEFSASTVDDSVSKESPGVIEFELTNSSQTTQYVSSGTVPPFGMVFADSVDSDATFLLWRRYEEEGCINFTDDGIFVCDIGTVTELRACESITRRYKVLPSETSHRPEYTVAPGPGTYRITDSVGYYEQRGAPQSELSFEIQFTLESPS